MAKASLQRREFIFQGKVDRVRCGREGVEVVKNEPCELPEYGKGQFTEKRVHLSRYGEQGEGRGRGGRGGEEQTL